MNLNLVSREKKNKDKKREQVFGLILLFAAGRMHNISYTP